MKTIPKSAETSRQLYYQLEREQQEMVQLRIDMEKRLKTALSEHNQKLAQLARRCEALESGEAAQILIDLSDDDVAGVLRQMQSEKAASVNVLLKRLGRDVGKIK
jgi:flagellar motility protein MotE (MotC chaperone)